MEALHYKASKTAKLHPLDGRFHLFLKRDKQRLSISSHGKRHFSTGKSIIFALNVGSVIASYKKFPLLYKGHFWAVSTWFC